MRKYGIKDKFSTAAADPRRATKRKAARTSKARRPNANTAGGLNHGVTRRKPK